MNGGDDIQFRWLATESLGPSVVEQLKASGISISLDDLQPAGPEDLVDTDDAGFEPLLLIAGAAALAHLATAVSRIVRDHRQGGVVLDTRHSALTVRGGVRGLDSGTLVVVGDEGTQKLSRPDENAVLDVLRRK
jgi:hypothetical protein